MGWLGWTPKVALAADVNAIQIAFKGKVDMLKACFGGDAREDRGESREVGKSPNKQQSRVSSRPITPRLFDSLFGG